MREKDGGHINLGSISFDRVLHQLEILIAVEAPQNSDIPLLSPSESLAASALGVGSSRSIGREIRTRDQPSRPHGPFLILLHVACRGARQKGKSGCDGDVYLPDLEQPRPPDAPPGLVKLRLVKKA
jgi:hypothetical protein